MKTILSILLSLLITTGSTGAVPAAAYDDVGHPAAPPTETIGCGGDHLELVSNDVIENNVPEHSIVESDESTASSVPAPNLRDNGTVISVRTGTPRNGYIEVTTRVYDGQIANLLFIFTTHVKIANDTIAISEPTIVESSKSAFQNVSISQEMTLYGIPGDYYTFTWTRLHDQSGKLVFEYTDTEDFTTADWSDFTLKIHPVTCKELPSKAPTIIATPIDIVDPGYTLPDDDNTQDDSQTPADTNDASSADDTDDAPAAEPKPETGWAFGAPEPAIGDVFSEQTRVVYDDRVEIVTKVYDKMTGSFLFEFSEVESYIDVGPDLSDTSPDIDDVGPDTIEMEPSLDGANNP